jgi:hypothetical protein
VTNSHPIWRRLVPAAALIVAGVASVVFAVAVASGGSNSALAATSTSMPGHPDLGSGWQAPHGGPFGSVGQVAITITAINGSKLSLQTTDGWTRTIDSAGATITKAGQNIGVVDLKVGDSITFRESRQSDGSYKITTIAVVVPTASGTVTAVTTSTVTITQPGGTSRTLNTTGSTTYTKGGAAAARSDLVVGSRISAQGTLDSSGTFTATAIEIAPSAVQGIVASKTASTIVVTTSAGKAVTVNVTASTTYSVRGQTSATLANVAVGDRIAAQGTLNSDGSLTATAVQAAPNDQPGFGGGFGGHGFGGGVPRPAPSAGASAGTGI